MRYLLDTCVLSEVVKKKPNQDVIDWLDKQEETSLYLSVITFGELQKGISKLSHSRRRRKLEDWVGQSLAERFAGRILDVGFKVASRWGEDLWKSRKGRPQGAGPGRAIGSYSTRVWVDCCNREPKAFRGDECSLVQSFSNLAA